MRESVIVVAFVAATSLLVGTPAWSDKGKKGEEEEGNVAELVKDARVTVDQAIKTATEKMQGTVVEAELEKKHGKTIWEVEIVGADGKVTEVHIDAGTGAVIDTEEKKMKEAKGKGKGRKD
jgi:uncharacterized membrane protein YkoI